MSDPGKHESRTTMTVEEDDDMTILRAIVALVKG
jgi:hypothetical protein